MTTVRTIKLKRVPQGMSEQVTLNAPSAESAAASPAGGAAAQATPAASPEVATTPVPKIASGATVSGKSYLPYTLAASFVVVIFLVIMGLQYSEMSLYQAEPSVWISK